MALLQFKYKNKLEAGLDEAGRGCLAGPVVAGGVILDPKKKILGLNDSKKLSEKRRNELREEIEEKALAWSVAFVSPEEIDKINILQASFKAMHLCVESLKIQPEFLLIDGNRFNPYPAIEHECIIKGDGKYASIAAASILAKTHRDEYMLQFADDYEVYGWKTNKGYPSKKHREAVIEHGLTPLHRKSFKLKEQQLALNI